MHDSNMTMRHEAAQAGKTTYWTGKPCKRGHLCDRYVSNGGCVGCLNPKRNHFPDDGAVFHPLPVLIVDRITREHAEELKKSITYWAEVTLKGWGYRTFLDGPIVTPYEFVPRTPQGPAK